MRKAVTLIDNQQEQTFRWQGRQPGELRYLLYLPKDYDEHKPVLWPLVVFLHGRGERGNDLHTLTRNGIPRLLKEGQEFPFIVVSPQCPADTRWVERISLLTGFVEDMMSRFAVDANRVYCTGISMGGFGTWALVIANPNLFAAIMPICGGGEPQQVCAIKHVPVWTFHGDKDSTVPIGRTEEMVNALKTCGGNVQFTVYPGVGHDSWTQTYNNPQVFSWLLEHTRA